MNRMKVMILLTLLVTLALSACGGSDADATPTMSVEMVQTLAVMTYQAQLTETARAFPTITPLPTETPIPVVTFASPETNSVVATNTTAASSGGASAACYGLSFVSDVTIPDNTKVTPGQSFTKTTIRRKF